MPAFYVNGMFTDASPPALNISGFEPCQHRDAIQWHQEHRTSWIKVLPISAECDAGVESVQRSTLYVSFGPRNSSTGRCENVSLILKRRFPFDAGSSEAISYRKTFSSFPEIGAMSFGRPASSELSLKLILRAKNYKKYCQGRDVKEVAMQSPLVPSAGLTEKLFEELLTELRTERSNIREQHQS